MSAITPEQAGGVNVCSFLDLIAWAEGTSTSPVTNNFGYDVIVSGVKGPEFFTDYSDHPFARGRPPQIVRLGPPQLVSTASGRYQLLLRYWRAYKESLHLTDFSPLSQDLIAIQQINEKKALPHINTGAIHVAIGLCSGLWASLPGNDYKQGGKTLEALNAQWSTILRA